MVVLQWIRLAKNKIFCHYLDNKQNVASLSRSSLNDQGTENHFIYRTHVTSLEIGMYVLLTVFCAAMAVFVASCFVYASKYRRQEYDLPQQSFGGVIGRGMTSTAGRKKSRSVQNAHDWVWLGKSTVDKGDLEESLSVQTSGSRQTLDVLNSEGDDHFRRKSNRVSCASSSAEVNVIANPNDEIGGEGDYFTNSSEQFQYFLQERRNQARKRQQQVFGMSALIPPSHGGTPRNQNGGSTQGRHYAGYHRKLPTPPPGHPAYGRIPFLQHKSRASNVTNIGNRNEPLNSSNSFSRPNKNQAPEMNANHPQSNCKAITPPKRGAIIEEPIREYIDAGCDNQSVEFVPSAGMHRALNSPRRGRKWDRLQQKLEKNQYSGEPKEEIVVNRFELEDMQAQEGPQVVAEEILYKEDYPERRK